mgnify:CR=1 FL=1
MSNFNKYQEVPPKHHFNNQEFVNEKSLDELSEDVADHKAVLRLAKIALDGSRPAEGGAMKNVLNSLPFPAIYWSALEPGPCLNKPAYAILNSNDIVAAFVDKLKEQVNKEAEENDTFFTCKIITINGRELLTSLYKINKNEYLALLQDIEQYGDVWKNSLIIKSIIREHYNVLDDIHDAVVVADKDGVILHASESFSRWSGVDGQDIIGKNVYQMEAEGVFIPSATARVIKEKRKVTILQRNKFNRELVVTAVPVFGKDGEIDKIVSFSRDITDFLQLKDQYAILEGKIKRYQAEIDELKSKNLDFPNVIGRSQPIQELLKQINKVASTDASILLTGETGVGKSMFAKIIHSRSSRSKGPFIDINCGAIPENLLESELFGYESGAFTGAKSKGKIGLIELAQDGTLFLDEIAELPYNLQAKLLKVLEEKTFIRLGGTNKIKINFRLISATNQNIKDMISKKLFREDLYYRLNVVSMNIPPLRERRDDLFPMIMHFVEAFNKLYDKAKSLSPSVLDLLLAYDWPGNVRELENVIERLIVTTEGDLITEEQLPANIKNGSTRLFNTGGTLREVLQNTEKYMVVEAYNRYKTTVAVAKALGISQPSAARKIKKYCTQLFTNV